MKLRYLSVAVLATVAAQLAIPTGSSRARGPYCLGGQAQDDPITTSDASYFFVNGACT
jgi:hypothetical protein